MIKNPNTIGMIICLISFIAFMLLIAHVIDAEYNNLPAAEENEHVAELPTPALTLDEKIAYEQKICLLEEQLEVSLADNLILEKEKIELLQEIEELTAYDAFTEEEWIMIYRVVRAEAGSWSEEGQRNVMFVLLNRLESDLFPDTIEEIIMQKGQFACVSDGNYNKVEISEFTISTCKQAYLDYYERGDNAEGALFFATVMFDRQYLFTDEVGHNFFK